MLSTVTLHKNLVEFVEFVDELHGKLEVRLGSLFEKVTEQCSDERPDAKRFEISSPSVVTVRLYWIVQYSLHTTVDCWVRFVFRAPVSLECIARLHPNGHWVFDGSPGPNGRGSGSKEWFFHEVERLLGLYFEEQERQLTARQTELLEELEALKAAMPSVETQAPAVALDT